MRPALALPFAALLAACAPAPPPPPAAAGRDAANPADPIERANAVDPAVRAAKDRQDEAIDRQSG